MPLSAEEAFVVFNRKVENELEKADALRMGAQLCAAFRQRIGQLEQILTENKIPVPPPIGSQPPPSTGAPVPGNVVPGPGASTPEG